MISVDLPNSPMLLEPTAVSADWFALVSSELSASSSEAAGLATSSSGEILRSESASLSDFIEAGVLILFGFAVVTNYHLVTAFSS